MIGTKDEIIERIKAKYEAIKQDPQVHLEQREFWAVFYRCLTALPPALADAFVLCEVDQVDSKRVCKDLSINPTTLWTRLHRARLALGKCLEAHWFGRPKRRT